MGQRPPWRTLTRCVISQSDVLFWRCQNSSIRVHPCNPWLVLRNFCGMALKMKHVFVMGCLLSLAPLLHAGTGKESVLRQLSDELAAASEKIKPSVVSVSTTSDVTVVDPYQFYFGRRRGTAEHQELPRGMGSGVLVEDGYVLTNNHVIQGADKIYIKLSDGHKFQARVVGADPSTDVAVVKIQKPEGLTPAELGDSDAVRVGDWVLAVGNPFGLDQTVTAGIISAKGRSDVKLANYGDYIQTDAAINPGNSGGPLVDLDGKVIGLNSAIISQSGGYQGIGFAIPINQARTIMQSLIKDGKVTRGYLGVHAQELTQPIAEALGLKQVRGVIVVFVEPNSPAQASGLEAKDIITSFGGKPLDNPHGLSSIVRTTAVGQEVEMNVVHQGQERVVKVKIVAAPPEVSAGETVGITVADMDAATAARFGFARGERGVVVAAVDNGSKAAGAGLRAGDVIVGISKVRVSSAKDYSEMMSRLAKEEKVLFTIIRNRQYYYVVLPLK